LAPPDSPAGALTGIAPAGVAAFIPAQLAGMPAAVGVARLLFHCAENPG